MGIKQVKSQMNLVIMQIRTMLTEKLGRAPTENEVTQYFAEALTNAVKSGKGQQNGN